MHGSRRYATRTAAEAIMARLMSSTTALPNFTRDPEITQRKRHLTKNKRIVSI